MVCAFICVVSTSNSEFPGNVFVMDTSVTSVSPARVLKVFPSTTRSQCLHRCRRTKGCGNTAMVKHDECWLLKDEVDDVVNDDDKSVTVSSFFSPAKEHQVKPEELTTAAPKATSSPKNESTLAGDFLFNFF